MRDAPADPAIDNAATPADLTAISLAVLAPQAVTVATAAAASADPDPVTVQPAPIQPAPVSNAGTAAMPTSA